MKKLIVVFGFCMLLMSCSSTREQNNIHPIRPNDGLQFVTKRIIDLRCLYLSQHDIRDLESRQLCSVIMISEYVKWNDNIPTGDGMPLDKILSLRFGKAYDGQVKVVSQDSIIQTSIKTYNPKEQMAIKVHPGDLVFINGWD